jgi:hypothetical protein
VGGIFLQDSAFQVNKQDCLVKTFSIWNYKIFEDSFPKGESKYNSDNGEVYGISFTPPKCETVWICFLSNYRMSSFVNLEFYGNSQDKTEKKFLYMLATKTQFAGPDIHKTIIHLFKYLNKKGYFESFEMHDESEYWETGNELLLDHHFKIYSALIDKFALAIESTPFKQGESYERLFRDEVL